MDIQNTKIDLMNPNRIGVVFYAEKFLHKKLQASILPAKAGNSTLQFFALSDNINHG